MGRVAARMFAAEGARVVVADVTEQAAQSVVDEVKAAGGQAIAVVADVSKEPDAKRMIDETIAAGEEIPNNAIPSMRTVIRLITITEWDSDLQADADAIKESAEAFITAAEADDHGAVAEAATAVHDGWHDFSEGAWEVIAPGTGGGDHDDGEETPHADEEGEEHSDEETPEATRINLEGEDGGPFIRRGGEGLQALQHLVATTFRRQLGEDNRIIVDCNGFRRDKDAEIRQMAISAVQGFRLGPLYTPHTLRGRGTIFRPSIAGGANRPGAAVDPETGMLYVPSRNNYSVMHFREPRRDEGRRCDVFL